MPRQEIFDTVAAHLIAQGERSTNDVGCAYRGADGLKCAIGRLIPDDLYTPKMEGKAVRDLTQSWVGPEAHRGMMATLERLGTDEADLDLLSDLQSAHDNHLNWPDIGHALREVADRFGLEARF